MMELYEEITALRPHIEKVLGRDIGPERVSDVLREIIVRLETQQNEVKELKHKKGVPTVIEYQGRRYVLDHANNRTKR